VKESRRVNAIDAEKNMEKKKKGGGRVEKMENNSSTYAGQHLLYLSSPMMEIST
jgi:hypothetical protein